MKKQVAWSYSALTAFETCPMRYYRTRVKKDTPDPPGEAALWGQRVHKHLEDRLGKGEPLPDTLAHYEPIVQKVEALGGEIQVEQQVAVDRSFKRVAWFDKSTWARCVYDVRVDKGPVVALLDWKTGKRKPENDQLDLFAMMEFTTNPSVEEVHTGFIWLKERKIDKSVILREQLPHILNEFLPRVERLEAAHATGTWQARPSGLCNGWCPVKDCDFFHTR